ncbi:hypothetical protein I215_00465 [Galbibacter marinus]|uniref:DUF4271 domain-containing protein n=1 Tax=Galbibacter marinus TaxID=555500 RepID=K2Q6Y3_9FLAO|nr:DUF4271 domain-containing protein [Galbibacter marinus]EKF56641.1 hypothetical protein I215_00465 [Galbibacter marinus]
MDQTLRNIDNHSIETILLTVALVCLTVAKFKNEQKFHSFIMLFVNYQYLKIYSKEPGQTTSTFNLLLFIVQMISFSLVLWIALPYFDPNHEVNFYLIMPFLILFILFKFYLEKLIATIFDINKFTESFHFHKVTYRNLTSLLLLPMISLFIYSNLSSIIALYAILLCFCLLNVIAFVLTLRNHQKLIQKYLFYFILYLCTLEIAPYLLLIKFYFGDKV